MIAAPLKVPHVPQQDDARTFSRLGYPVGGFTSVTDPIHKDGCTYIGTVSADGNIVVGQYNESTKAWTLSPPIATGFADWHDAPSVLIRSSDNKILVAYCAHDGPSMYVAVSTNAEDVTSWGAPTNITSSLAAGTDYTYPTLFQLSAESGKIYMFWRNYIGGTGTAQWYFSTSANGGTTWAAGKIYWQCAVGKAGYSFPDSDGISRIDFIAGDNSSNIGSGIGSAYHFYYSGGNFYKSNGVLIGSTSTPVTPSTATKIYDGTTNGGLLQPGATVTNGSTPRCTIDCLSLADNADPANPNDPLNFWYCIYDGVSWSANLITADGQPASYSKGDGNPAPDPNDPTVVYVSKFTGNVWKYVTPNGGATWTATQLTFDTDPNCVNQYIEPVRGTSPKVKAIWLYGQLAPSYSAFPQTWEVRGYPAQS